MNFRKTVGAYLTGRLIVQPLFTALRRWQFKREMESPNRETRLHYEHQAQAVVDAQLDAAERSAAFRARYGMPRRGVFDQDAPLERLVVVLDGAVTAEEMAWADYVVEITEDRSLRWKKDRYGDVTRPSLVIALAGTVAPKRLRRDSEDVE